MLCVTGKFKSTGGFSNFNYNTAPLVLGDTRQTYFMKRNSLDDNYNTLDIYNWNSSNPYAHLITLGCNTNCCGIAGVTAPNYQLDVGGDTNVSSGSVYRLNGTSVISSTTLGSGIVNSSLTSLGTVAV